MITKQVKTTHPSVILTPTTPVSCDYVDSKLFASREAKCFPNPWSFLMCSFPSSKYVLPRHTRDHLIASHYFRIHSTKMMPTTIASKQDCSNVPDSTW